MFFKRIRVDKKNRALVIKNGQLFRVLAPGTHFLWVSPFSELRIEFHSVPHLTFRSRWSDELVTRRKDLLLQYFHLVETRDSELAMISVDGNLYQVLLPSRRALFWKDGSDLKVEYVDVIDRDESSEALLEPIESRNRALDNQLSALEDSSWDGLFDRSAGREVNSSSSRGTT